jgi:hypothetical protein
MSKKLIIGFVVSIVAVMFICAHGYSETMTFPLEETDSEMIPFPEEGFFQSADGLSETTDGGCRVIGRLCIERKCGCDGADHHTHRRYIRYIDNKRNSKWYFRKQKSLKIK